MVLKAGGTVEDYEANANFIKASLREQLQCFSPLCVLTVTVEAGSVILTVVATDLDTSGVSKVASAAVTFAKSITNDPPSPPPQMVVDGEGRVRKGSLVLHDLL